MPSTNESHRRGPSPERLAALERHVEAVAHRLRRLERCCWWLAILAALQVVGYGLWLFG